MICEISTKRLYTQVENNGEGEENAVKLALTFKFCVYLVVKERNCDNIAQDSLVWAFFPLFFLG